MGEEHQALTILLRINQQEPKEASIHINLGKIYKKLGKKGEALHHFNIALDLDPKDINQVKSMIDRIHQSEEMNDEGDDLIEFR